MDIFDDEQSKPSHPVGKPRFYTPPPEKIYPLQSYPITLEYSLKDFDTIKKHADGSRNDTYYWLFTFDKEKSELSFFRIDAGGVWVRVHFEQKRNAGVAEEVFAYPDMYVDMLGEERGSKKNIEKELGGLVKQLINGILGLPPLSFKEPRNDSKDDKVYPLKRYSVTLEYSREEFKEIVNNLKSGAKRYQWNFILSNNELAIWRIDANGIWIKIPFKESGDQMVTKEVFAYPDMFVDMWSGAMNSKKIIEEKMEELLKLLIDDLLGVPPLSFEEPMNS